MHSGLKFGLNIRELGQHCLLGLHRGSKRCGGVSEVPVVLVECSCGLSDTLLHAALQLAQPSLCLLDARAHPHLVLESLQDGRHGRHLPVCSRGRGNRLFDPGLQLGHRTGQCTALLLLCIHQLLEPLALFALEPQLLL